MSELRIGPRRTRGATAISDALRRGRLGDLAESVIETVTGGRLPSCGGCKDRRDWMNENLRLNVKGSDNG